MLKKLLEWKHAPLLRTVNNYKIPITVIALSEEGVSEFNSVYQWILNKPNMNTIKRTPSGGISMDKKWFRPPMWDISNTHTCVELTILLNEGMWRIQVRNAAYRDKKKSYSGSIAMRDFIGICKKHGINLDDYAIENVEDRVITKNQIKKPLICFPKGTEKEFINKELENVHHLDYNSSYPAGLVNYHPEFAAPINELFEKRKTNDKYKAMLNFSIGAMQSTDIWTKARWAHLSRDAINDNYDRLIKLAAKVQASGRKIILFNTDGFWYQGDIYHDEDEGTELGQWKNDHINCKFRAKSVGSYEFIEDGKYTPVVRGITSYEKVCARSEWEWGDIYKGSEMIYEFILGVGLQLIHEGEE